MSTSSRPSAANAATGRSNIVVHVFGRTDVGRTREHNEDTFVVADLSADRATLQPEVRTHVLGSRGTVFMVADGMGGAAAGEIASAMAVETVLDELRARWIQSPKHDPETFALALKAATEVANTAIHRYATEHPENRGMGTTATIAGLLDDALYLAQVGDSRAYLVRQGVGRQITKDQSLMQKLIDAGELTEEEAAQSDRRNIILQALGPEPRIRIDLTRQPVRRGDTLVLCSDGLSGQVTVEEIARAVHEERDLAAVCRRLIDLANEAGGPDNITVVVARFDGEGLPMPNEADAVGHQSFLESDATPTIPVPRYVAGESAGSAGATPAAARAGEGSPGAPAAKAGNAAPPAAAVAPRRADSRPPVRSLLLVLLLVAVLLAAMAALVLRDNLDEPPTPAADAAPLAR